MGLEPCTLNSTLEARFGGMKPKFGQIDCAGLRDQKIPNS